MSKTEIQPEESWLRNIKNERHGQCLYIYLRTTQINFRELPSYTNGYEAEKTQINLILKKHPQNLQFNLALISCSIQLLKLYLLDDIEFKWLDDRKGNKLLYLHGAYYTRIMQPIQLVQVGNQSHSTTAEIDQLAEEYTAVYNAFLKAMKQPIHDGRLFTQLKLRCREDIYTQGVPAIKHRIIILNQQIQQTMPSVQTMQYPSIQPLLSQHPLEDTGFEYCKKQILSFFDMQMPQAAQRTTLNSMRKNHQDCFIAMRKFKWLSINNKDQLHHIWDSYKEKIPHYHLMLISNHEDIYYAIILGFHFFYGTAEEKAETISKIRTASTRQLRRNKATKIKQCNFEISISSLEKLNQMKKSTGMTKNKLVEMLIDQYPFA